MANQNLNLPALVQYSSQEAHASAEHDAVNLENVRVPENAPNVIAQPAHSSSYANAAPTHGSAPTFDLNAPPLDANVMLIQTLQQLAQQMASSGSTRQRNSSYTDFLNLKPPTFKGSSNATEAEEWIEKIERIFILMRREISEDEKVDYATYILLREALNWWKAVKTRTTIDGTWDWSTFKTKFLKTYFPESKRHQL